MTLIIILDSKLHNNPWYSTICLDCAVIFLYKILNYQIPTIQLFIEYIYVAISYIKQLKYRFQLPIHAYVSWSIWGIDIINDMQFGHLFYELCSKSIISLSLLLCHMNKLSIQAFPWLQKIGKIQWTITLATTTLMI